MLVSTVSVLASSYYALGRIEEALSLREQVLDVHVSMYGYSNKLAYFYLLNVLQCYKDIGDEDKGVLLVRKALDSFKNEKKQLSKVSIRYHLLEFQLLENSAESSSVIDRAQFIYMHAREDFGALDPLAFSCHLQLATLLSKTKQKERCLATMADAFNDFLKMSSPDEGLVKATFEALFACNFSFFQCREALDALLKLREIENKAQNPTSLSAVTIEGRVILCLSYLGLYKEALDLGSYLKNVTSPLDEADPAKLSAIFSDNRVNLKGDIESSISSFRSCIMILEKSGAKNFRSRELLRLFKTELTTALIQVGKPIEAFPLATILYENATSQKYFNLISRLVAASNLARCYIYLGKIDEAFTFCFNMLRETADLVWSYKDSVISLNNSLVECYILKGDFETALGLAESNFMNATAIYNQTFGICLRSASLLIKTYLATGNYEKAGSLSEATLSNVLSRYGSEHYFAIQAFDSLSRSYLALGKDIEALELAEKVVANSRFTFGEDSVKYLEHLLNFSACLIRSNRNQEALEKIAFASQKVRDLYGDHHYLLKYASQLSDSVS